MNSVEEYSNLIKENPDARINKTFQYNKKEHELLIEKPQTYMYIILREKNKGVIRNIRGLTVKDLIDEVSEDAFNYGKKGDLHNKLKNVYLPITIDQIIKDAKSEESDIIRFPDHISIGKIEFDLQSFRDLAIHAFDEGTYKVGDFVNDRHEGHGYIVAIKKTWGWVKPEMYLHIPENKITKDQLNTIKKIYKENPIILPGQDYYLVFEKYLKDHGMSQKEFNALYNQITVLTMTEEVDNSATREDLEKEVKDLDETQQNVINQYARGGLIYNAIKKELPNIKHIIEDNGNGWYEANISDRKAENKIPRQLYQRLDEDESSRTLYQETQEEFNQNGYTTRFIKFLENQKQEKVKRHVFEQWLISTQYGQAKKQPLKKEELIFAEEILKLEQFKTEVNLQDYIDTYASRLFKIETSAQEGYEDFGMDNLGFGADLEDHYPNNAVVIEIETGFKGDFGRNHYENRTKSEPPRIGEEKDYIQIDGTDVLSHYRSFL